MFRAYCLPSTRWSLHHYLAPKTQCSPPKGLRTAGCLRTNFPTGPACRGPHAPCSRGQATAGGECAGAPVEGMSRVRGTQSSLLLLRQRPDRSIARVPALAASADGRRASQLDGGCCAACVAGSIARSPASATQGTISSRRKGLKRVLKGLEAVSDLELGLKPCACRSCRALAAGSS
eukprot:scaffold184_cov379-Prasinococcus_capsulatus_cf.AAC.8